MTDKRLQLSVHKEKIMSKIQECEDCGFEYTVRSEPDFNKCTDCQIIADDKAADEEMKNAVAWFLGESNDKVK